MHPRIAGQFGDIDGYSHPHSFLRLPNGNVLATFQMQHGGEEMIAGGLVELTPEGEPVRSSSAVVPDLDPLNRVYSAAVVPALDRVVSTTTDMNPSDATSRQIQIWRLSDLAPLHTITLPDGPRGDESRLTAEPRVLADGRTVLVCSVQSSLRAEGTISARRCFEHFTMVVLTIFYPGVIIAPCRDRAPIPPSPATASSTGGP